MMITVFFAIIAAKSAQPDINNYKKYLRGITTEV